jgi:hypothetical protein
MYNAEFETDKYIRETFFPDFDYKGIMVEVGAGPTVFYSMSKHFRDYGWRCVCIDPNPKFVSEHKKEGNEIYQLAVINHTHQNNNPQLTEEYKERELKYEIDVNLTRYMIGLNVISLVSNFMSCFFSFYYVLFGLDRIFSYMGLATDILLLLKHGTLFFFLI